MKQRLTNIVLLKLLFILVILPFISCGEPNIVDIPNNNLPNGISGYTTFNYTYLSTAPLHTQTSMLTGYQNKLYRIGSSVPIQILDFTSNSWSNISLPDSSFGRWDGAAVTIKDSIYIIATSGKSNDILKLLPLTNSLQHTNVELPSSFHYPAYCTHNNKVVFFSLTTENVFEFDPETNNLNTIVSNPFFNSSNINLTLSSGKYQNFLYVFGGYYDLPENLFYRLNLENYLWEKLNLPASLTKTNINGAVFRNQFILIADTMTTYEYSFLNNEWYLDTARVPIYTRLLDGSLDRGEMSFFAEDSCLYVTDVVSDKIWKITK